MKKRKNLETELRNLNIPFEKHGNKYLLWPNVQIPLRCNNVDRTENEIFELDLRTQRECWRMVKIYHRSYKQALKEKHNSRQRAYVRDKMKKEDFENLEGKQFSNRRDYD